MVKSPRKSDCIQPFLILTMKKEGEASWRRLFKTLSSVRKKLKLVLTDCAKIMNDNCED